MIKSPNHLLSDFAETRSEAAFRELVRSHFDLVYATALRLLGGDTHAAQDVAQEVFLLLAKKAGRLPKNVAVGGWLYRQACRRASNAVRGEVRRRRRDRESLEGTGVDGADESLWEEVAPQLDAAMLSLPAADRDAVVLRFLEGRSHRAVGEELGISEEAARKRVGRAIESLRASLSRRGVGVPSVVVLGSILANAVTPAPVGAAEAASLAGQSSVSAGISVALVQVPALLGGCVVGLLVSGIVYAAKSKELKTPEVSARTKVVLSALVKSAQREPGWKKVLRDDLSLEQILEEVRSLAGEPQHALTLLKREALLASIGENQKEAFVALVIAQLGGFDRGSILKNFYQNWVGTDPESAISSLLALPMDQYGSISEGGSPGRTFLEDLYVKWVYADTGSASEWLLANIAQVGPRMGEACDYCRVTAGTLIAREAGLVRSLAFVEALPQGAPQEAAFAAMTSPLFNSAGWLAILEGVGKFRDPDSVEKFQALVWKEWGREIPDEAMAAAASLTDPGERQRAALALFSVQSAVKKQEENADGSTTTSYGRPSDREERAAEMLEAAEAAGIPRSEIIVRAFSELGSTSLEDSGVQYLLKAREGTELDAGIVRHASRELSGGLASYWDIEGFLGWAKEIHDPQLRQRVLAGGLRRLAVIAPDRVDEVAASPALDAEGRAVLDGIVGEEGF